MENNDNNNKEEIIELSDILVGTSQEDEEIIELTEDLVDEARDAISGATLETKPESQPLELTEEIKVTQESADKGYEQEITGEIDNYFSSEKESDNDFIELDEPLAEPVDTSKVSISDDQLEAVLERIVEKKYLDKIEALIEDVIRHKVSEDIESIRELILSRSVDKKSE